MSIADIGKLVNKEEYDAFPAKRKKSVEKYGVCLRYDQEGFQKRFKKA